MDSAEQIVRDLAATNTMHVHGYCRLCGGSETNHGPVCAWERARQWVNRDRALGFAAAMKSYDEYVETHGRHP